jgi:hypothetical protein
MPQISQGTLNLIRCSIIIPSFTNLSITPEYMSHEMAGITFDGPSVEQYDTGTGLVNSPQPYVKATISCTILKTQGLAASWFAQFQSQSILGTVEMHPDDDPTTGWPVVRMHTAALMHPQPGRFNGKDPGITLTISGKVNTNSSLFNI